MNNNYKIIFLCYDKLKNNNFNNKIIINSNNNLLNELAVLFFKIFIIIILIVIFNHQNNNTLQNNKIKSAQSKEIQNSNKILKNEEKSQRKPFWNNTLVKNEMHSYSLYNTFKKPQFSLILKNNGKPQNNINKIGSFIKNMMSKNFSDFEIVLYNMKKKDTYNLYEKQMDNFIKNNILKIYTKQNKNNADLTQLIYLISGYYTIFINPINFLDDIPFNEIFQHSKNDIKKYHLFNITNDKKIYIYKTNLLKNLADNGYGFVSNKDIIDKIKEIHIPEFNYIHISICPNNNFTNLVYVAMISILSSKATNTFICFYLIIPKEFKDKNKNFIISLEKEYDNFNLTFIKMDNRYNKAYTDRRITTEAYYRFSLGELIPNLNKIIYLDADIIVYKDLSCFYNLNFNGKIILGQPTYGNRGKKKGHYKINTGILLLNLLEMRKINFEKKVIKLIEKGIKLRYHDQTLLNDYFDEYIGIFPIEFHTRPWSNYKEMKTFNNIIGKVFDHDYYYFAHKYPTIRHFLGRYKPKKPNINYIEDWWFFARKSKYYNNKAKDFYQAFSF